MTVTQWVPPTFAIWHRKLRWLRGLALISNCFFKQQRNILKCSVPAAKSLRLANQEAWFLWPETDLQRFHIDLIR